MIEGINCSAISSSMQENTTYFISGLDLFKREFRQKCIGLTLEEKIDLLVSEFEEIAISFPSSKDSSVFNTIFLSLESDSDYYSVRITDQLKSSGVSGEIYKSSSSAYLSYLEKNQVPGKDLLLFWDALCFILEIEDATLLDCASIDCPYESCYNSVSLRPWRTVAEKTQQAFYESIGYKVDGRIQEDEGEFDIPTVSNEYYREAVQFIANHKLSDIAEAFKAFQSDNDKEKLKDLFTVHKVFHELSDTVLDCDLETCPHTISDVALLFNKHLKSRFSEKTRLPPHEIHDAFHKFYDTCIRDGDQSSLDKKVFKLLTDEELNKNMNLWQYVTLSLEKKQIDMSYHFYKNYKEAC